jgi:hypothetical protein
MIVERTAVRSKPLGLQSSPMERSRIDDDVFSIVQ